MAKIGIYVKYLGMSWTYLYLLYRFCRRTGGDDYPIFVWQSPKGPCYGNQLNLEDVRRRRQERPSLFASSFDNGLVDGKSAFKRLNGNIRTTLCTNLVNIHPIISEFMLLKRAIFAAIRSQFYDISSFVTLAF